MARPFCASCTEEGPGLHPIQLEDGGPIFLFCERCDSEVTGPPVEGPPPGIRWTGGTYYPTDQIETHLTVRILRMLRRFGWVSSSDISDFLGIPSTIEDPTEQNNYSVTLSRLCREGYIEAKMVICRPVRKGYSRRHTGFHQWKEYRISPLGIARLNWMLQSTMAPIHEGRLSKKRNRGSARRVATPDPPPHPR